MTALIRNGLAPPGMHLLTTSGAKTGAERTNPVQLIKHGGRRWLVAPYGEVSWVHNARTNPRVTISRRGRVEPCDVREATPEEAAPVLKKYLVRALVVLPYFEARPTSPLEAFAAEAARHPVFELSPLRE